MSEIDQCYIHLNAAYLAFSVGNYAQSKRELERAREIYHAKNRGYPPRGAWGDAFDDIVILCGKLTLVEKQRKNPKNIHFDGYDFAIEGGRYKRISGGDAEESPLPRKSTARRRAPSTKAPEKQEKYNKEAQLQAWTDARNSLEKGRGALIKFAWSRKPVHIESARLFLRSARWSNVAVNSSSLYLPEEKAKIRKEISELARAIESAESETRSNPMRRNHHLSAGSFASGKVRVIRPFGLRKSGEDLYLVDGKALKPLRKNTGKHKLSWRRDEQDPDFLIARVGATGAYVITNLHGVGDELEKLPVGVYALSFYRNWVGDDKTYRPSRIKSRIRGLARAKKEAEEHYQKTAARLA